MQAEPRQVHGGYSYLAAGPEMDVRLVPTQIASIEAALETWRAHARPSRPNFASKRWGIPSAMVRVDMPPIQNGNPALFYEVEGGPGGLGMAALTGAESVCAGIAEALRAAGVSAIAWDVAPSRLAWEWELALGTERLAAAGLPTSRGLDRGLPFIMRSGGEDKGVPWELCLCDYGNGGGDKKALAPFGVVPLSDVPNPLARFTDGFTLKPRRGTGTRNVYIFARHQPFKREGTTLSCMERKLDEAFSGDPSEWVVQPFLAPEVVGRYFRIWRIFAAWDGSCYRVVGGMWNARKSLRIHGATDTIFGPIHA